MLKLVTIEVIGRPMIKMENITKFRSPIHSNRSLIEEKNLNSRQNWGKLHKLDGQWPKWKSSQSLGWKLENIY